MVKKRWHFLFFLISIGVCVFWMLFPPQPIWQSVVPNHTRFSGFDEQKQEWYALTSDENNADWAMETRRGLDSAVALRVKLEIPALQGDFRILQLTTDIACVRDIKSIYKDKGLTVETTLWIVDRVHGRLILPKPIQSLGNAYMIDTHASKIAEAQMEKLVLHDVLEHSTKELPLKGLYFVKFSPNGKLLLGLNEMRTSLNVIHLDSLQHSQQKLPDVRKIRCYAFLNDETLLLQDERGIASRWKWDGAQFQRMTKGVEASRSLYPLPYRQMHHGELALLAFIRPEWPLWCEDGLRLLERIGLPVNSWFRKQQVTRWNVYDKQDRLIRRIDAPLLSLQQPIYNHYAVEVKSTGRSSTHIQFWSTVPRWPNSLAAGMLVYLGLYVAYRIYLETTARNI
jgi:hypothetical protein